MSTSKLVHELDSATLRPFVDSNPIVLLAVLMLPQSEQCQMFVPAFHSVSNNVTSLPGTIMVFYVFPLIGYARSPRHQPKSRLLLAKSTSQATGTPWHLSRSQPIRISCFSRASTTTKRTKERLRRQGRLSCRVRHFLSPTNTKKYHLLLGPLFTVSCSYSNKRLHINSIQEQLQRRDSWVHCLRRFHYYCPVRESSQSYTSGACVRRHRRCGSCASRRCSCTCTCGIQ
jgi:hypothetical protein